MAESTFELFETESGAFRWRLCHDGTVIAASDDSYSTRQAAMRDVQRVKHTASEAGVESVDVA